MESFRDAVSAASHPLARSLFEVDGIADVFMVPAFITVTKHPGAAWDAVWPAVTERLEAALADRQP